MWSCDVLKFKLRTGQLHEMCLSHDCWICDPQRGEWRDWQCQAVQQWADSGGSREMYPGDQSWRGQHAADLPPPGHVCPLPSRHEPGSGLSGETPVNYAHKILQSDIPLKYFNCCFSGHWLQRRNRIPNLSVQQWNWDPLPANVLGWEATQRACRGLRSTNRYLVQVIHCIS